MRASRWKGWAAVGAMVAIVVNAGNATAAEEGSARSGPVVTISSPLWGQQVPPGDVLVWGSVRDGSVAEVNSVVFAADVSTGSSGSAGHDCSGDGRVTSVDDLNADGRIGEVLDCQVAAIIGVNRDVATVPGSEDLFVSGVAAYGATGVVAQMSATPGVEFVPPGRADGARPNIEVVARSLRQGSVSRFTLKRVDGDGIDLDVAARAAVESIGRLPFRFGTRRIFLMATGGEPISRETLDLVSRAEVYLHTFAIGPAAASLCDPREPVYEGNSCTVVADPADLPAAVAAPPRTIESVTIHDLGPDLPARVNAYGIWQAVARDLTPGEYTPTVEAMMSDGFPTASYTRFTVTERPVERWAGTDRYAASAMIALRGFNQGGKVLYLASGEKFTDALSGAPAAAAGGVGAPVLLTSPTAIRPDTAAAIRTLRPARVVLLGGTDTLDPSIEAEVRHILPVIPVERWAGADRYETSALISRNSFAARAPVAFIASGAVFSDALSGAPIAGRDKGPLLLTDRDNIPAPIATELRRLAPARIVVLGGPTTISAKLQEHLVAFTTGTVSRWAGSDRYTTSAAISAASFRRGVEIAYIASGGIYTDALSGAPVAGATPGPLLLTRPDAIPSAIHTELRRLRPQKIVILGGPNTITTTVEDRLAAYVRPKQT